MITLGLWNLKPTPTILELEDLSTIRLVGKMEDITILVDSWQCPVNIFYLHTQSLADEHPLILGIHWLATADAYIGYWSGNMVISNGEFTKNRFLYPLAKPSSSDKPIFTVMQKYLLMKDPESQNEEVIPILTISEALCFKDEMKDDAINTFLISPNSVSNLTHQLFESVMSCNVQENMELETEVGNIPVIVPRDSIYVEIEPGKTLNINLSLSPS